MKASDELFSKLMDGSKQFIIPVFQRDYRWSESDCVQLFNDVVAAGRGDSDTRHFIGSIVYIDSGDSGAGFSKWLLIDGQQRMTTISLLVLALRDHISETKYESPSGDPDPKRLNAYFLQNVMENEEIRKDKLVLRRVDRQVLHALLVTGEVPTLSSSKVLENYERFRELLADTDPSLVFFGINRLVVVDVRLHAGRDDPQLIFESLNSTGVALKQSDLIRNYVLMRIPEAQQTKLYDEYWSKIEDLFRGSDDTFDVFARDFLAFETGAVKQVRGDQVYESFRSYFSQSKCSIEELLARMLKLGRFHAAISMGRGEKNAAIAQSLARLNRIIEVAPIVVMRLYLAREANALDEAGMLEAVLLLESYVFRRAICGGQTRGYWETFARLAHSIDSNDPLVSLKVALKRLRDGYRFPHDEEFSSALQTKDVYGMRTCVYMLERLENFDNKEPTDVTQCTIEHVMPQNKQLHADWQKMLGPNWRDVHSTWVHRLGNITLTGYNGKYSDRPFEDKKTIKDGFNESTLRLNVLVRNHDAWNQDAMMRRGQLLAKECIKAWKPLVVSEDAVSSAEVAELRKRSLARSTNLVPMEKMARELFELLRKGVIQLGDDVIELAELKSVSYHSGDFFAEVLPRKHSLLVIVDVDFNECDDPSEFAKDTSDSKFIPNAKYSGGTYCHIRSPADIPNAMHLIRQACELSRK